MGSYHKVLTLALPDADADGISTSQTPSGAGNLTITGALASGGVANLVTAQRVLITTVSNESSKTLTITGTDRYGRAQTEAITGPNATTATSTKDFLTVTQIAVSAAFTGAVTVGTVAAASTAPFIPDRFQSPGIFNIGAVITGTANISVQYSLDDLAPSWDMTGTQPTWYAVPNFDSITATGAYAFNGVPVTMFRLTQNSGSSGASTTVTIVSPMGIVR